MKQQNTTSRRGFLRTGGQAAAALISLPAVAPAVLASRAPNQTIGVGCIGLGTRGGDLINECHVGRIVPPETPGAVGSDQGRNRVTGRDQFNPVLRESSTTNATNQHECRKRRNRLSAFLDKSEPQSFAFVFIRAIRG